MDIRMKHLLRDLFFILFSIAFAITISKIGLVDILIAALGDMRYLGAFVAGILFTSVFTTATSIALFLGMAGSMHPLLLGLIGGTGAVLGDFILFRIMRDNILNDVQYLLSFAEHKRIFFLFKTKLFRFFLPLIGAIIIASPFPDELGITLLSMSHVNNRLFLTISYLFNSVGIFFIALLGSQVA